MMISKTPKRPGKTRRFLQMKKLMTMMLGLSLALGCVAVSFAQDTTTTKKSSKKKAPKKKKSDTTKS